MEKNEQQSDKAVINYIQISNTIASGALGDIITIDLPKDIEFTKEDYNRIYSSFEQTNKTQGLINNIFTNPDFILSLNEQNTLTIYKDTSMNLGLFMTINKQIQQILDKHPQAYPLIMNQIVERIPENQRGEIAFSPTDVMNRSKVITFMDTVPVSVLKALIRLTNDSNPKNQH